MDVRVAKCLMVSKVLAADGMITENERNFLEGSMKKLGLDEGERRKVFDLEGFDEAERVLGQLSEEDRRTIVRMLVDAASVDGRLSPLEMQAVKQITAALGLAP
jgi:uncharacterized tellurite resistance protein B-like protein